MGRGGEKPLRKLGKVDREHKNVHGPQGGFRLLLSKVPTWSERSMKTKEICYTKQKQSPFRTLSGGGGRGNLKQSFDRRPRGPRSQWQRQLWPRRRIPSKGFPGCGGPRSEHGKTWVKIFGKRTDRRNFSSKGRMVHGAEQGP